MYLIKINFQINRRQLNWIKEEWFVPSCEKMNFLLDYHGRFHWATTIYRGNISKKSKYWTGRFVLDQIWLAVSIKEIKKRLVLAREPWPTNTFLYVPLKEQMVTFAQDCLSTFCLLRKARVPALTLQHARNAPEMSSTGRIEFLLFSFYKINSMYDSRLSTSIDIE